MNYTLVSEYLNDNKELHKSLAEFAKQMFGIHFFHEHQVQAGIRDYVPFSYAFGNRIIANISVGKVNLFWHGKEEVAYLLQTVGVLPEFRGQGLMRALFEPVNAYIEARGGIIAVACQRERFTILYQIWL